jgi:predicted TIM-barrel fold metal-dependent hydrolase
MAIPIFDSNIHFTSKNGFINPADKNNKIAPDLLENMNLNNIRWAFIINDNYGNKSDNFVEVTKSTFGGFFPIFNIKVPDLRNENEIYSEIKKIKKANYVGIKIHLRSCGISFTYKLLPEILKISYYEGLCNFICTYYYSNNKDSAGNPDLLVDLLYSIKDIKVVLLHGGGVRLLETMEIARAFENTLLDLSYTLIKYKGSSLDLDINYLFKNFDKRICIGTDFPEFSHRELRDTFDFYSLKISEDKQRNIAFRNIINFCNLTDKTGLN